MYIQPPTRQDRTDPPISRWRRTRSRLLRPMLVVSLVLHLALLAALLLMPAQPPEHADTPESSFEIVMNGGAANPTAPGQDQAPPAATPGLESPAPGPQPDPAPPPTIAPAPIPDPAPPPPAPEVQATPPAPEPPAPETPPEPAPPAPEAPPVPEPPPPVPETPPQPPEPPQPETPPRPSAPPRVELPAPELPELVPLPAPPPPLPPPPPPPTPAPPRPRQLARPLPRSTPRNPSGFPAPQDWSFTGGLVSPQSRSGASGQSLMAGPSLPAPHITGAQLGRDWIAAYTAWVRAHLYYPEQAALNGEDGTAEVLVNIDRTGKVLSVELVTRSGSQWLDLSTTGMFRGAHVPAFPPDTKENDATVDQTIQYILRRR